MNWGRKLSIVLLMLTLSAPAMALELFGVTLESTTRDELRDAAKEAGLVLVREGGEDNWFDVYDSSTVLGGSTRFYLGFVKEDQRFAFAEYEFRGLNSKQLQQKLSRKYGAAEVHGGRFMSDRSYSWQRDGIEIKLSSDWQNYRTRLIYLVPANMNDLLAEKSAYSKELAAEQVSLY